MTMYFEFSENYNSPIVCNLPHSGTLVPEEHRESFVIKEDELRKEIEYMADNYTDTLYGELLNVSSYIKLLVSRVVIDIERFKDERDEPMSKVGMSALYTRTSRGEVLRVIEEEKRQDLEKIYDEYHALFTNLVSQSLSNHNTAFIIDCHSFPSIPRVYEPDQKIPRPDICIGVDEYHTPQALVDILKDNFETLGYLVEINSPFSGSIVPLAYYKKEKRVVSVMIEVNRKLYMNEETFQKLKIFPEVSKVISRCIIKSFNQFNSKIK